MTEPAKAAAGASALANILGAAAALVAAAAMGGGAVALGHYL